MLRLAVALLPESLRRTARLMRTRRPFDLRRLRPRKTFSGAHVAVVGIFRSPTGIGRAAELVSRTLERRGSHVSRVDLSAVLPGTIATGAAGAFLTPRDCGALDVSDVVLVLNGDQTFMLSALDRRWLLDRCIVGHWIWELERLPKRWSHMTAAFDEIWAPTNFVLEAIKQSAPEFKGPLRVIPYDALNDPMPKPSAQQRQLARVQLNLSPRARVIGYSFSVASNYQRKNPGAAVRAFETAFPGDGEPTILILRCQDLSEFPAEQAQIKKLVGENPRIWLFDRDRPLPLEDFYAVLDLYLSPSRAEGYGLNLVEAAQAGIPVVTTGWRIAPEIAALPLVHLVGFDLVPVIDPQDHYTQVLGARWAEPRQDEMVTRMRRLLLADA